MNFSKLQASVLMSAHGSIYLDFVEQDVASLSEALHTHMDIELPIALEAANKIKDVKTPLTPEEFCKLVLQAETSKILEQMMKNGEFDIHTTDKGEFIFSRNPEQK